MRRIDLMANSGHGNDLTGFYRASLRLLAISKRPFEVQVQRTAADLDGVDQLTLNFGHFMKHKRQLMPLISVGIETLRLQKILGRFFARYWTPAVDGRWIEDRKAISKPPANRNSHESR